MTCARDFSRIYKSKFPECPICRKHLDIKEKTDLNSQKEKMIRYLKSTKIQFDDEEDFIRKTSHLFNIDLSEVRKTWAIVRRENHSTIKLMEHKFKNKQEFRLMKNEKLEYRPEVKVNHIAPFKLCKPKESEKALLKETQQLDGLDGEWKEGKMTPVDPKRYRNVYQDRD